MKKKSKNLWQVEIKKLLNVGIFLTKFFIFSAIMLYFYQNLNTEYLQVIVAKIISFLVHGQTLLGNIIYVNHAHLYLQIIKECVGIKTIILMLALLFATPGISFRKKALLAPLYVIFGFVINIFRILLAVLLSTITKAEFYAIYDTHLMAIVSLSLVLWVWYQTTLKSTN